MTKIISFGLIVLLASIIFVRGFSSRSLACRRRAVVGPFSDGERSGLPFAKPPLDAGT
jgi:hypothetical protein